MSFDEIKKLFDDCVIANYSRIPIAFVRAEGSHIWDSEGNRYVDLMPGWGTSTIGHCHPRVVTALQRQAAMLIHVDNTFYTQPQGLLAQKISQHSFGGKCFFCNSGAEAVEAAIKLARLHKEKDGRYKIITMRDSFHGRTMGAITATGQDKYHKGYLPLLPGFSHVDFNDLDAVKDATDDQTCAVMLEPIQGEGGINLATDEFFAGLRAFCDQEGLLLIADEVQTGIGRTGRWFGYQHYGIEPDIMVLAKALGGGVAIGAMVAKPEVAQSLAPGTHASTFGGNPLACAAALATFKVIEEEDLIEVCRRTSEHIFDRLRQMAEKYSIIQEVRGRGVMCGVELNRPGAPVFQYCLDNKVRLNCTHETVVRLLPAINVPRDALDEGLDVLDEAFQKAEKGEI
ncbi:MAG: aspartate aminotransferase family protein [Candidatus Brocadiae bacterium]|nr:aspartate aminotransferase family protein [Candidatus Brocadiia bacterium]